MYRSPGERNAVGGEGFGNCVSLILARPTCKKLHRELCTSNVVDGVNISRGPAAFFKRPRVEENLAKISDAFF